MNLTPSTRPGAITAWHPQRGLSLVELMVAITIGLLILAALLALNLNVTRTNSEMAKANRQIENGRFAIQLLQDDLAHAGFWGTFVPEFNDLTLVGAPLDAPDAFPNPCLTYSTANWTTGHTSNLVGIPVQSDTGTCTIVASQQANTDVLVVRHADTCSVVWDSSAGAWAASSANCDGNNNDKLYFQSTLCEDEISAIAQNGSTVSSITMNAAASGVDDYYNGAIIRIVDGYGKGLVGKVTDYDGTSKVATLQDITVPAGASWTYVNNGSFYTFGNGYALGTDGFIFNQRNCTTPADKRKFISNLYYVRSYGSTPGDGTPTLMRSSFDLSGGTLTHQAAQPLIEGIEGFRVEYGIDNESDSEATVNNSAAIAWADPLDLVSPTNRGDGVPDNYVDAASLTCASAAVCDAANVVAVRIHVLARSESTTAGYTDTKTYNLAGTTMGPYNDGYKRHVFSTTVRLVNPAGRRDTP